MRPRPLTCNKKSASLIGRHRRATSIGVNSRMQTAPITNIYINTITKSANIDCGLKIENEYVISISDKAHAIKRLNHE